MHSCTHAHASTCACMHDKRSHTRTHTYTHTHTHSLTHSQKRSSKCNRVSAGVGWLSRVFGLTDDKWQRVSCSRSSRHSRSPSSSVSIHSAVGPCRDMSRNDAPIDVLAISSHMIVYVCTYSSYHITLLQLHLISPCAWQSSDSGVQGLGMARDTSIIQYGAVLAILT